MDNGQSSTNFPKNKEQVRDNGKHSLFFSNLFIAISRTTNSLYFVEKETQVSKYFKNLFKDSINQGEEITLESTSIEKRIEWIKDKSKEGNLSGSILLEYCSKVFNEIEQSISFSEPDTVFKAMLI
ncbi:MAG: hypothetical protein RCG15_03630 [Candidatus Rickettsia vulgarisii]